MTATRLIRRRVEKVWGRRDLPAPFAPVSAEDEPIGEIWFEHPDGREPELLVKYLFTSERLSIQVHPDDEAARAGGYPRGKDEAWVILKAEPDATIGLGLRKACGKDELKAAALDGRIEEMIDWRGADAGDSYYSPAGVVHALGPGLMLVEVQQNVDLTYRLYDYGRPRELHLEKGIPACNPVPYVSELAPYDHEEGRRILAKGPAFVLERWSRAAAGWLNADIERPLWLIPLTGGGTVDGGALQAGTAWLVEGPVQLIIDGNSEVLFAYPGGEIRESLIALSSDPVIRGALHR